MICDIMLRLYVIFYVLCDSMVYGYGLKTHYLMFFIFLFMILVSKYDLHIVYSL